MINKWIKGVITDRISDRMKRKGWKQIHKPDNNSNSSGNINKSNKPYRPALSK